MGSLYYISYTERSQNKKYLVTDFSKSFAMWKGDDTKKRFEPMIPNISENTKGGKQQFFQTPLPEQIQDFVLNKISLITK